MNKIRYIQTVKLKYRDDEYSLIPSMALPQYMVSEMMEYLSLVGVFAYVVDDEMYLSEAALFNLALKYVDEYIFI